MCGPWFWRKPGASPKIAICLLWRVLRRLLKRWISERELASRLEIYLEQYIMSIKVELNLTVKIAKTMIFPAAIRYQGELVSNCASLKMLDYDFDTNTLDKVTELVKSLQDGISELEAAAAGSESEDMLSEATHCCHTILPLMNKVRATADELEGIVADDLWPLPTYQEMLFIK